MQSDIKVVRAETFCVDTRCRTPLKFGAVVVDELPIGYARVEVETRSGKRSTGWGAMFLMDLWAWPVSIADHRTKSRVMCDVFAAYGNLLVGFGRPSHPIELFMETERELESLSKEICNRLTPGEVIPFLGALVAASPFDHAVHDAFGKANEIDSYLGYGPEHMSFDLSRYLGAPYEGVYPSQFLRQDYVPELPVFHLVGGLDVLRERDVADDAPQDGIPNSLEKWIETDGVYCLKVKLKGRDVAWDLERTREVSQIFHEVKSGKQKSPIITADTNEQCESPQYVVEYLRKLKEMAPEVFDEVLYVEQPTERDLQAHRWDMREVAKLKPVLIDESLTSVDDFRLALELGWSGVALKSCKCLSSDLLFVAMAEMAEIPYAVQDLTCPSLALLESVGLAARIHTMKGVEANSRQFFPAANDLVAQTHPGIATVRDGRVRTSSLRGPGLGMRVEQIPGFAESLQS